MRKILIALFVLLAGGSAWASRLAVVIVPADLRDVPKREGNSLKKLSRGVFVVASNNPVDGFYKVRLKDQTVGWIAGEQISFEVKRTGRVDPKYNGEVENTWMR